MDTNNLINDEISQYIKKDIIGNSAIYSISVPGFRIAVMPGIIENIGRTLCANKNLTFNKAPVVHPAPISQPTRNKKTSIPKKRIEK